MKKLLLTLICFIFCISMTACKNMDNGSEVIGEEPTPSAELFEHGDLF